MLFRGNLRSLAIWRVSWMLLQYQNAFLPEKWWSNCFHTLRWSAQEIKFQDIFRQEQDLELSGSLLLAECMGALIQWWFSWSDLLLLTKCTTYNTAFELLGGGTEHVQWCVDKQLYYQRYPPGWVLLTAIHSFAQTFVTNNCEKLIPSISFVSIDVNQTHAYALNLDDCPCSLDMTHQAEVNAKAHNHFNKDTLTSPMIGQVTSLWSLANWSCIYPSWICSSQQPILLHNWCVCCSQLFHLCESTLHVGLSPMNHFLYDICNMILHEIFLWLSEMLLSWRSLSSLRCATVGQQGSLSLTNNCHP